MDCREALNKLESIRPDSNDSADREFCEALDVVSADSDALNEFVRRQNVDQRVGELMRDVPIPVGLRQRLLAQSASVTSVSRAKSVGRWALIVGGVASVTAACVAIVILNWSDSESVRVTSDELLKESPLLTSETDALPPFDGNFDLPNDGAIGNLQQHVLPLGWARDGSTEHFAAVFPFRLAESSSGAQCVLFVFPKGANYPHPQAEVRSQGQTVRNGDRFSLVVHNGRRMVHALFVLGDYPLLLKADAALFGAYVEPVASR